MRRDQLNRRTHQTSAAARAERHQSPQVIQRGGAVRHGGGRARRAFVKTTPGATTSVDVYLDTDATGTEVTVSCYIYGGGNLEDAFPTLVDGMPLWVQNDAGTWRNKTPIYKIGVNCG